MKRCPECGWPKRALAEDAKCWRTEEAQGCRRVDEEAFNTKVRTAAGGHPGPRLVVRPVDVEDSRL